jgi:small conductance mechanosensitive channel
MEPGNMRLIVLSAGQSWNAFKEQIADYLFNPDNWTDWLIVAIKIAVILIAGKIAVSVSNRAFEHVMKGHERQRLPIDMRRTKTVARLAQNLVSWTIRFFVIVLVLSQFGFNLAPILAGAGIIGLAVGFGAQSLVKDIITGFFIVFENQFAVGDTIQTGTYKGTVEEIGIRTTRIRSHTGEMFIIPNGMITQVTNFSTHNSLAIADVTVANDEQLDQATEVLKATLKTAFESSEWMVKEPVILGIQSVSNAEVTFRVTVECKPNAQAEAIRELNLALAKAFNGLGLRKVS